MRSRCDKKALPESELMKRLLPHYWKPISQVPAMIRLEMAINGWSAVWQACFELSKASRECGRIYAHEISMMEN